MGEFLSFKRLLTPLSIKVIFWIGVAMCVVVGVGFIVAGADRGLIGQIMVRWGIVFLLLGPLVVRIWCELLLVLFRILNELTTIARK